MSNKWYTTPGEWGDIVVSTRIRLARNLKDFVFPHKTTPEQREEIYTLLRDILCDGDLGYFAPDALTHEAKRSMAERYLLSREFAESGKNRAMLLSRDESVCLLLCYKDHIRLQGMATGLSLAETYQKVSKIDDVIAEHLPYAFHEKWGYLTGSPADLGTGMKASVLLHLPALEAAGQMEALAKAVGKIGLSLRGTFGQGSSVSGSLYQLSNQITMGIDEKSALENLKAVTLQLVDEEKSARQNLTPLQVEDAAYRALGILQNARILPMRECTDQLSNLRLGISMGFVDSVSVETVNALNAEVHPASLLLLYKEADSTEKRDVIRATIVREKLK